jgi:hypothetical protein
MIASGTMQTIEARLVRYVRKGAWHAVTTDIWEAGDQMPVDPSPLDPVLSSFDKSRSLFEFVGFVDVPEQADLLVDLSTWPILLAVLESERDREVRRVQDLAVDRRKAPLEDLRALDALISSIREKTCAPPRALGDQDYESLGPAPAGNRRSRGEG